MLNPKQKHDAKEALRSLNLAVQSIKSGYRFDDGTAELKITTIERSILKLENIIDSLAGTGSKATGQED